MNYIEAVLKKIIPLVSLVLLLPQAEMQGNSGNKCAAFFSTEPPKIHAKAVTVSKAEQGNILRERVCLISFPWPKSVDRDPEGHPLLAQITPEQMRDVRQYVYALIQKYTEDPPSWFKEYTNLSDTLKKAVRVMRDDPANANALVDTLAAKGFRAEAERLKDIADNWGHLPQEEQNFLVHVVAGVDPEQVRLYADFFYTRALATDASWDKALEVVDEANALSV